MTTINGVESYSTSLYTELSLAGATLDTGTIYAGGVIKGVTTFPGPRFMFPDLPALDPARTLEIVIDISMEKNTGGSWPQHSDFRPWVQSWSVSATSLASTFTSNFYDLDTQGVRYTSLTQTTAQAILRYGPGWQKFDDAIAAGEVYAYFEAQEDAVVTGARYRWLVDRFATDPVTVRLDVLGTTYWYPFGNPPEALGMTGPWMIGGPDTLRDGTDDTYMHTIRRVQRAPLSPTYIASVYAFGELELVDGIVESVTVHYRAKGYGEYPTSTSGPGFVYMFPYATDYDKPDDFEVEVMTSIADTDWHDYTLTVDLTNFPDISRWFATDLMIFTQPNAGWGAGTHEYDIDVSELYVELQVRPRLMTGVITGQQDISRAAFSRSGGDGN